MATGGNGRANGTWGNWRLNAKDMLLEFGDAYAVDLAECEDSAEVLDWIFQLQGKSFMTPQDMWDFLRAIDDLLHPQANLCSMGHGKTIKPKELVAAFTR